MSRYEQPSSNLAADAFQTFSQIINEGEQEISFANISESLQRYEGVIKFINETNEWQVNVTVRFYDKVTNKPKHREDITMLINPNGYSSISLVLAPINDSNSIEELDPVTNANVYNLNNREAIVNGQPVVEHEIKKIVGEANYVLRKVIDHI